MRGWNTVPLAEPVEYGALRISGGNGYDKASVDPGDMSVSNIEKFI